MRNEMTSAYSLVREKLEMAQDIARQAFDDPSEDAVMAVFNRLCMEADLLPEGAQEETVWTVH